MHPSSEWPTQRIPRVPQQWPTSGPPEPPRARRNLAAWAALALAVLGLVVLPILFGPAAVIAGGFGHHESRRTGRGMRLALGGLALGLIEVAAALGA